MCTTHTKYQFFAEHTPLRPILQNNKRKNFNNQPPSAHLSTAKALVTMKRSIILSQELIIDCGATHHMFSSEHLFVLLVQTPLVKVSTGDLSSSFFSEGTGTVVIISNGKIFNLENCLFVPRLK
ncbi:hypothetical protein O181_013222 [Austropuccinia psidii MF-1]|uniref:Retrovirus-related Pol polyprotein from transposon TNT 1-94-like beta-barrel domain-containing protein n=1 Tax=Austropuccinia psidii MF-1 TaxID=1389203 RepID=A0A9Q3BZ75_9BASI|nr:hypothetical protein [Austropuccinia psidii MF-1]